VLLSLPFGHVLICVIFGGGGHHAAPTIRVRQSRRQPSRIAACGSPQIVASATYPEAIADRSRKRDGRGADFGCVPPDPFI